MATDRVLPIRQVVKKNRFGEVPFLVHEIEVGSMVADCFDALCSLYHILQ